MDKISLINKRGRVVWVDQTQVQGLMDQGFQVISNPKQTYYPQYDQDLNKGQKISLPVHGLLEKELEAELV